MVHNVSLLSKFIIQCQSASAKSRWIDHELVAYVDHKTIQGICAEAYKANLLVKTANITQKYPTIYGAKVYEINTDEEVIDVYAVKKERRSK